MSKRKARRVRWSANAMRDVDQITAHIARDNPAVPQNVVCPQDVSRDDGEGDPAARTRTLACAADGLRSAN